MHRPAFQHFNAGTIFFLPKCSASSRWPPKKRTFALTTCTFGRAPPFTARSIRVGHSVDTAGNVSERFVSVLTQWHFAAAAHIHALKISHFIKSQTCSGRQIFGHVKGGNLGWEWSAKIYAVIELVSNTDTALWHVAGWTRGFMANSDACDKLIYSSFYCHVLPFLCVSEGLFFHF